eukprot:SAG31_NODE_3058_length_4735_cov_24.146894_4_plen_100_part_00
MGTPYWLEHLATVRNHDIMPCARSPPPRRAAAPRSVDSHGCQLIYHTHAYGMTAAPWTAAAYTFFDTSWRDCRYWSVVLEDAVRLCTHPGTPGAAARDS